MSWAQRRFRPALAAIVIVGLVVRLVYAWVHRDVRVWGDAYFYHESAKLIAAGHGWINPLYFNEFGQVVQAADHPPMYIAYLTLWTKLGVGSSLGHAFVSCLLGMWTPLVYALVARRVAGPAVGILAGCLAALYPNVWGSDGMLLSETTAVLFVGLVALAAYRYVEARAVGRSLLLGAALGAAALTRSEVLLLSLFVVVPVTVGRRPTARTFGHLLAAGAVCIGVLLPWVAFNLSRFDKPVYLSAGAEVTVASSTCDRTYFGEYTGYWSMSCNLEMLERAGYSTVDGARPDQSVLSELYLTESKRYIRSHLGRLPYVIGARWGRITGLYRPVQQLQLDTFFEAREPVVARAGFAAFYALAMFAIVGAVVLRRRRIPISPLVGPLAVVWFAVTVTFANNRYRIPAEGAICVLAAVGIVAITRVLTDVWRDVESDDVGNTER